MEPINGVPRIRGYMLNIILMVTGMMIWPLRNYLNDADSWLLDACIIQLMLVWIYTIIEQVDHLSDSQGLGAYFPRVPFGGGSALMIILGPLVALGVVPAGIPVQFVIIMASWRLLCDVLRNPAFRRLLPHYNALVEAREEPDIHGLNAVLQGTSNLYLWLNHSQDQAENTGIDERYMYLLSLSRMVTDTLAIPLKFLHTGGGAETMYTGVQSLDIKPFQTSWRRIQLGLESESVRTLQEALTTALVPRQCSDKLPVQVQVVRGPDALKNSPMVITVGRVLDGMLVIRREDIDFAQDGTRVESIRAIYFLRNNDANTDNLVPVAANAELQRYFESLLKVIFLNVIRPFMEYTATDVA